MDAAGPGNPWTRITRDLDGDGPTIWSWVVNMARWSGMARSTSRNPDEVDIFLNRGLGHSWRREVLSTAGSHGLQTFDIDGDGAPDLFDADWSRPRQTILWWHNPTRAPRFWPMRASSRLGPAFDKCSVEPAEIPGGP